MERQEENITNTNESTLQQNSLDRYCEIILHLSKGSKFIESVNKLIESCVNYANVGNVHTEYLQAINEELIKAENDPNYCIDEKKLDAARNKFFEHDLIKTLINDTSESMLGTSPEQNDFLLNIEKEFPEQIRIFADLFSQIISINDERERNDILQQVSEKLGLNYKTVATFFEAQSSQEEGEQREERVDDVDKREGVRDIEEVEKNLPPIEEDSRDSCEESFMDAGFKSMEELLDELQLSVENSGGQIDRDCRINALRLSLQRVHQVWRTKWQGSSAKCVRARAMKIRTRARKKREKKKGAVVVKEIEEVLAIMCRAHYLTSGGQLLRDSQLLAALVHLLGYKGTLSQMAAGEGKAVVVSMLAAAEVLLHDRHVDVIAMSEARAWEGHASRRLFLELLGISSASNRQQEAPAAEDWPGVRACYAADVVYGSMAAFQTDFLSHGFEGRGTRGKRSFGRVIIDEVDTMLIETGEYMTEVADSFPGLEVFRYVHINIWKALLNAEQDITIILEEMQKMFRNEVNNLQAEEGDFENGNGTSRQKREAIEEQCQKEFELLRAKILEYEIDRLKQKIRDTNPTHIDLIPAHLRDYASRMEEMWIDNALFARYQCFEEEHYVLRPTENYKETVIVPVDRDNIRWHQSLLQYLQLKHNLRVVPDAITTMFLSNLRYIKLYENRIWGLSSTLGSQAEIQLVADLYNITCIKIPSYKAREFYKLEGIVTTDCQWANVVALDAISHIRGQRSVFIFCNTIKDVLLLERNINALLKLEEIEGIDVITFVDEKKGSIVDVDVGPNKIVIATVIAGRGIDVKASKNLQENHNVHMCICFLPVNQRVEDQMVGKVSQLGITGSAQIIISECDVVGLGLQTHSDMNFNFIRQKRNEIEKDRILHIRNKKVKYIDFLDQIFDKFSNLHEDFKKKKDDPKLIFLAKDLKELWAFWLHKKSYSINKIIRGNVDEEFEQFTHEAGSILGKEKNGSFSGGEISYNPYYSISMAEFYLTIRSIKKSKNALLRAINLDSRNSDILYSAHLKLFEVEIESGKQLLERFRKALLSLVGIDLLNLSRFTTKDQSDSPTVLKHFDTFSEQKNEKYKEKAKKALQNADEALKKEINYMKENFIGDDTNDKCPACNQNNEFGECSSANYIEHKAPTNQQFINILISDESPLLKQIKSRFFILNTFHLHVLSLLQYIEETFKSDGCTTGLAIVTRIPNYLKTENLGNRLAAFMLEPDLVELELIGLQTIYCLREVHDVPKQVIHRAQAQIIAGIATAVAGACFPPALFVAGPVASTLISEGICDIALELISQGKSEFSEVAYIKGKIISYSISLVTIGIGALSQSVNFLDEAIKCLKSLSSVLNKCPYLKTVGQSVTLLIDNVNKCFTVLKYSNRISKATQAAIAGTRTQIFNSILKRAGEMTIKSIIGSIITDKIIGKQFERILKTLKQQIENYVREMVNEMITSEDLQNIDGEDLKNMVDEILMDTFGDVACSILKEISLGVTKQCKSWKTKITTIALDSIVSITEISNFMTEFCRKLKILIKERNKEGPILIRESVKDLKEILINILTDKMCNLIKELVGNHSNTFVVDTMTDNIGNLMGSLVEKEIGAVEEEKEIKFEQIVEAFELLGLEYGASEDEINKAWHRCAREYLSKSQKRLQGNELAYSKEKISDDFIHITEACLFLIDINKHIALLTEDKVSKQFSNANTDVKNQADGSGIRVEEGEKLNNNLHEKCEEDIVKTDVSKATTIVCLERSSQQAEVLDTVPREECNFVHEYDIGASLLTYMTGVKEKMRSDSLPWFNSEDDTLEGLFNSNLTKQLFLEARRSLKVTDKKFPPFVSLPR